LIPASVSGTGHFILGSDLEPISFDDLPLGGEWTTRRRTISEAEIALFGALAGDFSPLTIDVSHSGARFAPPALLVAVAIGLGTMDMPVPSVAEWEWLNWKFPRPVKAGETIYARWTLTQKRPPVGGAPTAIVVWRVDVHTSDGSLCAEGEVGASVRRKAQAARPRTGEATPAGPAPTAAAPSRRRRGRRPAAATAAVASPPPPVEAAPPAVATAPSGPARRRRRRRPRSGTSSGQNGQPAAPAPPAEATAPPPVPVAAATSGSAPAPGRLSRVIKRLRRP
jgi:acyl dehydratase